MSDNYTYGALHYDPKTLLLTMKGKSVSVLDADKILLRQDGAPQWWKDMVDQAQQIRSSGIPLLSQLPGGDYLLSGRYTESFVSWIEKCDIDYTYIRGIGVHIHSPHFPIELGKQMSVSGVQATTVASPELNPTTPHSIRLNDAAKEAAEAGFRPPSTTFFPSPRSLMKHQIPVTLTLAHKGRGLLADDVGSGKSSMFICGFFSLAQYRVEVLGHPLHDTFPLVIVTKKKLVGPISREVNQWFPTVKVHQVGNKKKDSIPMDDAHVIVTTPQLLANNMSNIMYTHPQGVVFDESHMFKNPMTKSTKAAMKLVRAVNENTDTPYVVCASATPMPNRPSELWSQLKLTGMSEDVLKVAKKAQKYPSRVKFKLKSDRSIPVTDQTIFEMRYCKARPGPFGWDVRGSSNEEELSRSLRESGFIRRKKSEFITPLPLLHQDVVRCEISDENMRAYRRAEEQFPDHLVVELRKKARKEQWDEHQLRKEITQALMKSSHSEAIMQMTTLRQLAGIAKIDAVTSWIHKFFAADPTIVGRDETRNKLIVFAHHREVQKRLIENPELQRYGLRSITSSTKNVNEIVDDFQSQDSGVNLLICYSEAREGLTLTAAKDILVAELPFVPSWLIQMAGRCWARISADYPPHEAYLHYAVADLEIDKYLEAMIRDKMHTSRTIIDGMLATDILNEAEGEE